MTPKAQELAKRLEQFLGFDAFRDEAFIDREAVEVIESALLAAKAEGLREGRDIAHAIATKYARWREARDGAIEVAEAIERRADAEGASK